MPIRSEHPLGQGKLFESDDLNYRREVTLVDGYEVPTTFGHEGSFVDVSTRAQLLVNALGAISARNSRQGISLAAYTPEYSAPIWSRYASATQVVLDGASRNRDQFHHDLRTSFWQATGFAAMRKWTDLKKVMPPGQINPRAQKMWDDFNFKYGSPKRRTERNEYKKRLSAQIASDEQLELIA